MSKGNKPSPEDKLIELLDGDDPAKKGKMASETFAEALKEVKEKRQSVLKDELVGYFEEAITIREAMGKAEREFNGKLGGARKKLGKVMGKINALSSGKPVPEEGEGGDGDGGGGDNASSEES